VRVITRAGPYRDVAIVPVVNKDPVAIDVGSDALTDEELSALQARLPAVLQLVVDEAAAAATTDPVGLTGVLRHGELATLRIKVRAAAGRERHKTAVECRVRVRAAAAAGGEVLVDVEGSALQLVQARNVSVIELADIEEEMAKNGGRNPLLAQEDTEAAIVAACRAGILAIIDDSRPDDVAVDEAQGRGVSRAARAAERKARLRRAHDRARAALAKAPRSDDAYAAALADVGATGSLADVDVVKVAFHDDHPLVRFAARAAFAELCAGHQLLPLSEGAVARCTAPPAPPPPSVVEPEAPVVTDRPVVDDEPDSDDEGPVRVPDVAPSAPPSPAPSEGQPDAPPASPAPPTEGEP